MVRRIPNFLHILLVSSGGASGFAGLSEGRVGASSGEKGCRQRWQTVKLIDVYVHEKSLISLLSPDSLVILSPVALGSFPHSFLCCHDSTCAISWFLRCLGSRNALGSTSRLICMGYCQPDCNSPFHSSKDSLKKLLRVVQSYFLSLYTPYDRDSLYHLKVVHARCWVVVNSQPILRFCQT